MIVNVGDEWLIVYDTWSTTKMKMAMPLFTFYAGEQNFGTLWVQNDHFWIPEPVAAMLLAIGGVLMTRRRR